jgi:hypothetical protein
MAASVTHVTNAYTSQRTCGSSNFVEAQIALLIRVKPQLIFHACALFHNTLSGHTDGSLVSRCRIEFCETSARKSADSRSASATLSTQYTKPESHTDGFVEDFATHLLELAQSELILCEICFCSPSHARHWQREESRITPRIRKRVCRNTANGCLGQPTRDPSSLFTFSPCRCS